MAFVRGSMLDVKSQNMEELRDEVDSIEKLGWSVKTPIQKFDQS